MRNVVELVFSVGLVIKHLGSPVCLDKQVSTWEQPGQGEQVGREGGSEDIQPDRVAFRGEEFICRVVLDERSDKPKLLSIQLTCPALLTNPPHWLPPMMIRLPSSSVSKVGYHRRVDIDASFQLQFLSWQGSSKRILHAI